MPQDGLQNILRQLMQENLFFGNLAIIKYSPYGTGQNFKNANKLAILGFNNLLMTPSDHLSSHFKIFTVVFKLSLLCSFSQSHTNHAVFLDLDSVGSTSSLTILLHSVLLAEPLARRAPPPLLH